MSDHCLYCVGEGVRWEGGADGVFFPCRPCGGTGIARVPAKGMILCGSCGRETTGKGSKSRKRCAWCAEYGVPLLKFDRLGHAPGEE